jgi:type II secretory pathway component GspD/PulD (secretin)
VKLKSVTQIPYVSTVSVGTTGASSNGNASLLGGAKTSTANDGITMEMTPTFDAYSNTVSVKMDLSIQAVVGFSNLSAGNQLGSLSQPTTAERSFNDIIRVRPGQTVVVGGLTYDSVGDNRSGPAFLSDTHGEHKALTVNRLTMFIVVRPTITMLGAMAEKEGDELYPEAPAVTPEAPAKPAKAKHTVVKG